MTGNAQASVRVLYGPSEVLWTAVSAGEVASPGKRLEASHYDIEARTARSTLAKRFKCSPLVGDSRQYAVSAYVGPRFRRVFVERGIPILVSHQVLDYRPLAHKYISPATRVDIDSLRLKTNMVLVTCSGVNAGQIAYGTRRLDSQVVSHDLLRVVCRTAEESAWLYAFLRSRAGSVQLKSNVYGTQILHIEPVHLENILVPAPDDQRCSSVVNSVIAAHELRDEANDLLDRADDILHEELGLQRIRDLSETNTRRNGPQPPDVFSAKSSLLEGRLEGRYHASLPRRVIEILSQLPTAEVAACGDARVTKRIFLPGRFKRVYVGPDQGVLFLSSTQIMQVNPVAPKYLSPHQHEDLIDRLRIRENTILVTCSGTIGRVQIAPAYFENFTASQHVLRVYAAPAMHPGYLYAYLASDYGRVLTERLAYGSVVPEVNAQHLAMVPVPIPKNPSLMQRIGDLVSTANQKRDQAWRLERSAIKAVDHLVFGTRT